MDNKEFAYQEKQPVKDSKEAVFNPKTTNNSIKRSWQELNELETTLQGKIGLTQDKTGAVSIIKEQLEILFGERWSENYQAQREYQLALKAHYNALPGPHPAAIALYFLAFISFGGLMIAAAVVFSAETNLVLANFLGLCGLWVPMLIAWIASQVNKAFQETPPKAPTLNANPEPTPKERFALIKKITNQIVDGDAQGVLNTAIYDGIVLQEVITRDELLDQKQSFAISSLLSDVIAAGVLIGEIEEYQKTRTEILKSELVDEKDKQLQKDLVIELMIAKGELEDLISETATRLSFIRAEILKLKQAQLKDPTKQADSLIAELKQKQVQIASSMASSKELLNK